ncbi:MAG: hypothetical protein HY518_02765 [Candidatus Aenigmarchaeota archaeon]|nr:hypothetical protein [Candidatus Aenigmarchaeota archaeon]
MAVLKVVKRHGIVEKFKPERLASSVTKACVLSRERKCTPWKVAAEVIDHMEKSGQKVVNEEDILDFVGSAMKKHGMDKAYNYYTFAWLHKPPSKIRTVRKRNGKTEPFSPIKTYTSIEKSFLHSHGNNLKRLDWAKMHSYTREAIAILEKRYKGAIVPVEGIRETVEFVLVRHNMLKPAKYYIMHRYL